MGHDIVIIIVFSCELLTWSELENVSKYNDGKCVDKGNHMSDNIITIPLIQNSVQDNVSLIKHDEVEGINYLCHIRTMILIFNFS